MSEEHSEGQDVRRCGSCGAEVGPVAKFCGACGAGVENVVRIPAGTAVRPNQRQQLLLRPAAQVTQAPVAPSASSRGWSRFVLPVVVALLAVAIVAAALGERQARRHAAAQLHAQVAKQAETIASLQTQNATLAGRLGQLDTALHKQSAGLEPLAQRVLKSVYTVESGQELGTAWVAWKNGGTSYLITANHVVADAVASGDRSVTLKQKGASIPGTVVKTDTTNDLAVVQTTGTVGPALWQTPQPGVSPLVGDALLLVGSPYGLEGTVTQGVVSRVTYNQIQTDAAANPGNSGGPAVDRQGEVVGVLLSGGGENLNFAAPIQRACVAIRSC